MGGSAQFGYVSATLLLMRDEKERRQLVRELAAAVQVDRRTVERWLEGERVRDVVAFALRGAVERFKWSERVDRARGAAA